MSTASPRTGHSTSEIHQDQLQSPRRRRIIELVCVLAAYLLAGEIGLAAPFTSGNVSPVWPAAGVALGSVLMFGYRIWPAIALGAFTVNFFTGIPHLAAAGIALGNAAGPLCGAWLLRQVVPTFQPSLSRLRDVLGMMILGALCGTAVSASVGAGALLLAGVNAWSGFSSSWLIWWFGDATGVLVVTPLALTFTGLMSIRGERRTVELSCLLIGALGSALLVFTPQQLVFMRANVFAFGVFPFVLWGAIRFEAAGAAIVSFLVSAVAVWGTAHGFGPFIKGTALQNATLMQSFLAVTSASGIILAAVIAERGQLIREQSMQRVRLLSEAVEQTADSVLITDPKGTIEYVNPAFESTTGYGSGEVVGNTPRILKSNLHDKEFYRRLWNQILGGESFRGTLVNRKKSGQLFWAEQTITPIKNTAGAITHFVSVLKDITGIRKQQEQELRLRLAREVQQRFYRGATISAAGFDIATAAYPADETGGDYVDLFSMPDRRICIGIGDVSGHGVDSAIVMALTRAYVRAIAQHEADLAKILSSVNRMLIADLVEERFVTLLLVCLDGSNGSLSYASAGHIPAFLMNGSGNIDAVLESSGPPLGLFDDAQFATSVIPLMPQQLLILLTDGAIETTKASEDVQFGSDGVLEYVRAHQLDSAPELAEGIYRAARRFAGENPQHDDITEVIVRVAPDTASAATFAILDAQEQSQISGHL